MWMNIYIHNVIVIVIVAVIVIVVVIVITHYFISQFSSTKNILCSLLISKNNRVYTKYYILLHAKLLDSIFMTCTAINSVLSLVML